MEAIFIESKKGKRNAIIRVNQRKPHSSQKDFDISPIMNAIKHEAKIIKGTIATLFIFLNVINGRLRDSELV